MPLMSGATTDEAEQEFNRQLGQNLKKWRMKRGITQADLAEATGYGRTSITNIESGIQQPDVLRLLDLAKALGVAVEDLVPPVAARRLPPPLVTVKIRTRHPENYVLTNTADGGRWVIRDGTWVAQDS